MTTTLNLPPLPSAYYGEVKTILHTIQDGFFEAINGDAFDNDPEMPEPDSSDEALEEFEELRTRQIAFAIYEELKNNYNF